MPSRPDRKATDARAVLELVLRLSDWFREPLAKLDPPAAELLSVSRHTTLKASLPAAEIFARGRRPERHPNRKSLW
jgi:hypothetical protein